MIVPSIHRALRRSDLTKLVLEIACAEPDAAEPAARARRAGIRPPKWSAHRPQYTVPAHALDRAAAS